MGPKAPWGDLHTPQGSLGCYIYIYPSGMLSVERLGLLQSVFAEYRAHTFFFLLLSSPYVHIHAAVDSMGDFSFSLTLESFVEANVQRALRASV